ncbi:MAG: hypothetical protein R3A10_23435 [Caldilineaceae bacterium]
MNWRAASSDLEPDRPRHAGVIVAAAGTSDLPVLEEASLTLDLMGAPTRIVDVGVAGLHRLLPHVATPRRPMSSSWPRAWKAHCPASSAG